MKNKIILMLMMLFSVQLTYGQSQEAQQLLLNVEKLSQLKGILSSMKKGYEVISKGYNSVKNIAEGNFSLHEVFLDAMMLVSPEVRKYHKIAGIITAQKHIVSEYKSAFRRFGSSGNFSVAELDYLGKVYGQLFNRSLDNLDQLAMIITAGKLRMSDDERLEAIDRIFADTQDILLFLRSFNESAAVLNLQRQREKADVKGLSNYFKTN